MSDPGWQKTLETYERKTTAALRGEGEGRGMHVPVYAFDLQYMLQELKELEVLRATLGKSSGA